jgi:uncharacterized membrane protein
MIEIIKIYITTLIVLTGLDGLWLGFISKSFYQKHLGYLFTDKVSWWPIAIFYPLYAVGVLVFAVIPALEAKSLFEAVWRGALLGLVAYAAYDLTNQATITKWPLIITVADLAWGVAVTTLTSVVVYWLMK